MRKLVKYFEIVGWFVCRLLRFLLDSVFALRYGSE